LEKFPIEFAGHLMYVKQLEKSPNVFGEQLITTNIILQNKKIVYLSLKSGKEFMHK
jgi:hypothetical protein